MRYYEKEKDYCITIRITKNTILEEAKTAVRILREAIEEGVVEPFKFDEASKIDLSFDRYEFEVFSSETSLYQHIYTVGLVISPTGDDLLTHIVTK